MPATVLLARVITSARPLACVRLLTRLARFIFFRDRARFTLACLGLPVAVSRPSILDDCGGGVGDAKKKSRATTANEAPERCSQPRKIRQSVISLNKILVQSVVGFTAVLYEIACHLATYRLALSQNRDKFRTISAASLIWHVRCSIRLRISERKLCLCCE
jgi:hypothetical protein